MPSSTPPRTLHRVPTTGTCTCATARAWRWSRRNGAGLRPSNRHAESSRRSRRPRRRAAYRERILAALPAGSAVRAADDALPHRQHAAPTKSRAPRQSGIVHAVKYYPAGATTNSDSGVTALERAYPALAAMERARRRAVDARRGHRSRRRHVRSRARVRRAHARRDRPRFPGLRIVLEHITTREAAEFVRDAPANVAATITPQHLLYSRNALFAGGIAAASLLPAGAQARRRTGSALVAAATSGNPKFFLGTDSAPHARDAKETHAAAPAAIRRRSRCRSTPKRSRMRARSTGSKDSPAARRGVLRAAAQCRLDHARCARRGVVPAKYRVRRRRRSCRFAPAKRCAGACAGDGPHALIIAPEASQTVAASEHPEGEESPGSTEQDAG